MNGHYKLLYDLTQFGEWRMTHKQGGFCSKLVKEIFGKRVTLTIDWNTLTAEASGEMYCTDRDILSHYKCAYNEKQR